MSQKQGAVKTRRGFKEFIRKMVVSLKRSPQTIPLISLAVAFLVYSLNLSSISHTTSVLLSANMGQCEFVAMLFSILAFVVFLRAFPKRQKVNKIMIVLLFLFLILLVFADFVYITRINAALTRTDRPFVIVDPTPENPAGENLFIRTAKNVVSVHIIFIALCAVLVATLPFYGKLIKKINTSIDVEGNMDMGEIDISGEE